jgi:hypothetical protein
MYIYLWVIVQGMAALACIDNGPGMEEAQAGASSPSVTGQTGTEETIENQPTVMIQAGTGATIEFRTHNGVTHQGFEPEILNIPHLTLFHNEHLSEAIDRRLHIKVSGLQIPPPGATVALLVETQTGDNENRIPVWETSTWVDAEDPSNAEGNRIDFSHTFEETIELNGTHIRTPSGYYRYQITIKENDESILYELSQDYAFLMESRWVSPLPDVPEESAGAAPDELVIYYCDMTPFQKDIQDPNTRIARQAVKDYVGADLLPRMVAAFRLQSQDWGFHWVQAWRSYRVGEDAERLSVALTDDKTWYHGEAVPRGSSSISINVTGSDNYAYDTLADGIMSTFHHELFHNLQKSLNLQEGGQGWISGRNKQWAFFSEGTAVLASSVAQPEIQFAAPGAQRAYIKNANGFLGSEMIPSDIGKDYNEINPKHAAIYWRFLYEHCGGMIAGAEDPAAGMRIIHRVLTSLYQIAEGPALSKVEGEADADALLQDWLPRIMDQALAGSSCPFQTYAESLRAFAQAVDALRFEGGRCQRPGLPEGCSFYDPHALYSRPPDDTLARMAISP